MSTERPPAPFGSSTAWHALLEQVFEDAPAPLRVIDARGQVLRQNSAQIAFNAAEGHKFGIGDFNLLNDLRSIEKGHAARFKRALAFETVEHLLEYTEPSYGELVTTAYQVLFVPIGRAPDDGPLVVLSALIDVSEHLRAEHEKEKLNAQLLHSQKLESLGVLAGGIAHDFNNLLMGVLGHASLLLSRIDPNSALRPHVDAIEKSAQRAADVAQQMLAYAGRSRVERKPLDLTHLVEESAALLRLSLAGRTELITQLAPSLPPIDADRTQLQQVVLNLVTNACEAMHDRPGAIRVRTGAIDMDAAYLLKCFHGTGVLPGRYVYLEVEDQGHGMDAATLPRIFDPFFSTKFDGRGLGLASVMGIVRGHKGAVSVESKEDAGTRFRVLFPASREALYLAPVESPRAPHAPLSLSAVLVVDDEELVLETAAAMLEQFAQKVFKTPSGRAAIQLYQEHQHEIEVVLLDLTMPDLDGAATLERLSAINPNLRAVVMSGYAPEQATALLKRTERTQILRKPFTLASLEAALTAACTGT